MPDFTHENRLKGPVAGIDEVGCGAWAGPVVAGAAILEPTLWPDALLSRVQDSKKLSERQRGELFSCFMELPPGALVWSIGQAEVSEITTLNIRGAAHAAMLRAADGLSLRPATLLIDGPLTPKTVPYVCIPLVKGDQLSLSIAVAAILAKVTRDRLMVDLSCAYPLYGWECNAGYGTAAHKNAIKNHGITPHHRPTYAPIRLALEDCAGDMTETPPIPPQLSLQY